jgi:putative sterol carrier protein
MTKFFSPDFFGLLQESLSNDTKWQEDTKTLKTSIRLTKIGDGGTSSYLIKVEDGKTSISSTEQAAQAEFAFEGAYETWTKVAKGEVDLQAAVLKGMLKFKGSITKILVYKDRFMRIAAVMRSIPVEF